MRRTSTAVVIVLLVLTTMSMAPASVGRDDQGAGPRFLNAWVVAPPSPILATDKRRLPLTGDILSFGSME
ncbi:MAG: hypothetical protein M3454_12045 [Actinomycetota bacterium]|nr:hypothetical protein [Actinomycetota bacterium]